MPLLDDSMDVLLFKVVNLGAIYRECRVAVSGGLVQLPIK